MIQLMLTDEQQHILDTSNEAVEVVDCSGRVLATVSHGFTDAELREIVAEANHFQPTGTLQQFVDRLRSQVAAVAK